ncbi:efflux RND transporter periplasmic adaptor subunit [Govanella unica]|uniref:Efflux RND transporter periplasmic adaptor subunit n=1 Tax=Govanella unica TaxID=2975056 RepID=A0A9X3TV46_9PROT|nr:efflux RND transporter periplasmic adaptor subunit [Govania unica]MDA5192418.1 efflux RND transporter periplasmic adaptor subunit [Govania unica]
MTHTVKMLLSVTLLSLGLAGCNSEADHKNDHKDDAEHVEAKTETTILAAMAAESGVVVEAVGPADLVTSVDLLGRVDFVPSARADVRAHYAGPVKKLTKTVGDKVRAGEILAFVESSQSLQTYVVTAPMTGVVLERRTNVGDVAGEGALYVIGDLRRVQAQLHVFPGDLGHIRDGQPVTVRSLDGHMSSESHIASFLPMAEAATQTLVARVGLPNEDGRWLPGMAVQAAVVVAKTEVPLAVRRTALQYFRGGDVVFVREGDVYKAQKLTLGRQSRDWVEVLSGLTAGQDYVIRNSFLIKADIEKAGAGHDH